MKRTFVFFCGLLPVAVAGDLTISSSQRVQVVHQDIAKWDKNRDGILTGAERDEFVKAKRKEAADAESARRAAKLKAKPPRQTHPHPALNPEATQNPVPLGVPKNIEEAQK